MSLSRLETAGGGALPEPALEELVSRAQAADMDDVRRQLAAQRTRLCARYPHFRPVCTATTPTLAGKLTRAVSVAKLTVAATPSSLLSFFCTSAAQDAHVIPPIESSTQFPAPLGDPAGR